MKGVDFFMGWNDHLFDDSYSYKVKCKCGAIYEITENDGVPGCREIEHVYCRFCGEKLAQHFGDCNGRLIDSSLVCNDLKNGRSSK